MRLAYEATSAEWQVIKATARLKNDQSVLTLRLPAPDVAPEADDEYEGSVPLPDFVMAKRYKLDAKEDERYLIPKQRMNRAIEEVGFRFKSYRVGKGSLDHLFESAATARDIRLELTGDPKHRLTILTEYRDFLQAIEKLNQVRFDAGALKEKYLEQSRYERLGAEIDLLQAKQKKPPG
jgi:hypothetical protein